MKSSMMRACVMAGALMGWALSAQGVIIDFAGGTAYLSGGGTWSPTDTGTYMADVDYYVEDGIMVDFVGGYGIIGNYYGAFTPFTDNNSVIHNHWDDGAQAIVFSKVDGTALDLNYVDLTSNTEIGGLSATGLERSYITPAGGASVLLPSSDWGINYLYDGSPGDGIKRLWLGPSFDGILSFTVTSENAFCFGLDNFYIDEPAPPAVPDAGSTLALLGLASFGLAAVRRRLTR